MSPLITPIIGTRVNTLLVSAEMCSRTKYCETSICQDKEWAALALRRTDTLELIKVVKFEKTKRQQLQTEFQCEPQGEHCFCPFTHV